MSPPSPSPTPTVASSSPPVSRSVAELKSLLRNVLRISILDGRFFLGTFVGSDSCLNIILVSTEEYQTRPGASPHGRYVGQIMIPWRLVVKVEVQGRHILLGGEDDDDELYT